jgi:D-alanine transaminase
LAKKNNIPVHEEAFDTNFVKQADELFLSGTTSEITPIVSVDGQPVGSGQVGTVVRKLQALFEENIRAEVTV